MFCHICIVGGCAAIWHTKFAIKDGSIEFTPMSGNGELFFTVLGFGYESAAVKHSPLSINRPFDNDRDKKVEIYREFLDARGNIVDLFFLYSGNDS